MRINTWMVRHINATNEKNKNNNKCGWRSTRVQLLEMEWMVTILGVSYSYIKPRTIDFMFDAEKYSLNERHWTETATDPAAMLVRKWRASSMREKSSEELKDTDLKAEKSFDNNGPHRKRKEKDCLASSNRTDIFISCDAIEVTYVIGLASLSRYLSIVLFHRVTGSFLKTKKQQKPSLAKSEACSKEEKTFVSSARSHEGEASRSLFGISWWSTEKVTREYRGKSTCAYCFGGRENRSEWMTGECHWFWRVKRRKQSIAIHQKHGMLVYIHLNRSFSVVGFHSQHVNESADNKQPSVVNRRMLGIRTTWRREFAVFSFSLASIIDATLFGRRNTASKEKSYRRRTMINSTYV